MVRWDEYGHTGGAWQSLLQELEPLRVQLDTEIRNPGHCAARAGQALDSARSDRVRQPGEHDWYVPNWRPDRHAGSSFWRNRTIRKGCGSGGDDDVRLKLHDGGGRRWPQLSCLCGALLQSQISPFNPTEIPQTLYERFSEVRREWPRCRVVPDEDHRGNSLRLLRLSGERSKREADSENDREPDPSHAHLDLDSWRESSRRQVIAGAGRAGRALVDDLVCSPQ